MNSFENLFSQQRFHQQQHLQKENKTVKVILIPDPSCIICHPAPLPSTLTTSFRSFFEWAKFILDARQYTGRTIENFEFARTTTIVDLQQYFYRQTFQALVYNKLPLYSLDQALQLVLQVHSDTSAFSIPLGTNEKQLAYIR
jgi:ATP-dependent Clp protease adapter protein ClpS